MAITKTEGISVRLPPDIKEALASAAESERWSLASMHEVMVLEYCRTPRHALSPASPIGKNKIGQR